jgi:predicted Zn-dependent protease
VRRGGLAVLVGAALLVAACDEPFEPPKPDQVALTAAQREIAATPRTRPADAGLPADPALVQDVARRLVQAAGRLSYSKADEREADYLGAYIMTRAGFDLDRSGTLWAKLTHLSGREQTALLDSHPAGPERLAAWRQVAAEIRANPNGMPRRER